MNGSSVKRDLHVVITDSGVGGLSVCAEVERQLRSRPAAARIRVTYFNAWPDQASGYNDMPDIRARAEVFDRALASMSRLGAHRIVIACNTLSIVYGLTRFATAPTVPVHGIVDAGVALFGEALGADPQGSIVLFGTKTTIESGVHRQKLIAQGIEAARIVAVACHGLARAIETSVDGGAVRDFIDDAARRARQAAPSGRRLYMGLCCTHYTYVRDEMRASLERECGRTVQTLDPNARLADEVVRTIVADAAATGGTRSDATPRDLAGVAVTVVSKVILDEEKRRLMAARLGPISPVTAGALVAYTHVPDLF